MTDTQAPDPRGDSPSRISRRSFLRVAAAGVALASLTGCSTGGSSPTTDRQRVQLVYQDWRTEWFPPMARRLLARFQQLHPDISVFYTPDPEDFQEQVLADMQAGTAPDVFQGCCAHFPSWAQKGYTLDLGPYVKRDVDQVTIDDWDPAQYESYLTADGRRYGVPKFHGALALYYNKDLFDKAGAPYPGADWDHEQYLDAMRELTRPARADGTGAVFGSMVDVSWDRLQVHVNAWGGHFVDPRDPTSCSMASAQSLAALEWLRARMWDDRVMATLPDVGNLTTRDAFIAGRLGMVEDGSWALKDILEKAPFQVGVAPFPRGPARRVTLATTDGFGIYARTRHPDAAWELVRFLTSEEYARAMAEASLLQPARLSMVPEWEAIVRRQFPEKAKDLNVAVFADGHRLHYSVTAEVFPVDMATASQLADDAWEKIFTLGKAPVSSLGEVAAQIQQAQRSGT